MNMNIKGFLSNRMSIQSFTVNWLQHRIIDRYYIHGPIEALAIGTGGGNEVFNLTRVGNNVTACEHDATAIRGIEMSMEVATGHSGSFECQLGGIEALATSKKFHYILLSQVLEHIQDDAALLARLSGIAAPHARLVISTPTSLHGQPSKESIVEPVATGPNHVRVGYEGAELDALAGRYSFLLIRRFYLGNPVLRVTWLFERQLRQIVPSSIGKLLSLSIRPLVLALSLWRFRPYVQISIYTKLPDQYGPDL